MRWDWRKVSSTVQFKGHCYQKWVNRENKDTRTWRKKNRRFWPSGFVFDTVSYPSLSYVTVTTALQAEFRLQYEERDENSTDQVAETPEEIMRRRPQCNDKGYQISVKNVKRLL